MVMDTYDLDRVPEADNATANPLFIRRKPMNRDEQLAIVTAIMQRHRSGLVTRREALRMFAGLGLGATGFGALGFGAGGAMTSGARAPAMPAAAHAHRALRTALFRQDTGTPVPAATPTLGERPDGSRVWRVRVAGMDAASMVETQAFFPKEITINAGDAIFFEFPNPPMFHTVTFLSGAEVPPMFLPDESGGAAASPPAGPPKLVLNPTVAFPVGGASYDGSGLVTSGLDVFRQPDEPFVLSFSTVGSYEYRCIPHGEVMKAAVIVQEAGSPLTDDQAAVDARGDDERAALIAVGIAEKAEYTAATAMERADGTTLWEVAAGIGEGQARVSLFFPDTLKIAVGDTVRWVNRAKTEPHTVTFLGAGVEPPEDLLLEPGPDGPPTFVQNPLTFFPQGEAFYGGEGYRNSGFMGELSDQPMPGTDRYELTFDTAGEFPYYCILHGSGPGGEGMAGMISASAP